MQLLEEAEIRFGSSFPNKHEALVKMVDTQVERIVEGDWDGYPHMSITPEEEEFEILKCRQMVMDVTLLGVAEHHPERNSGLYTRIMLAVGRTHRLATQYPSHVAEHLARQARALAWAHYDIQVPTPTADAEEDDTLSVVASSIDEGSLGPLEITITNSVDGTTEDSPTQEIHPYKNPQEGSGNNLEDQAGAGNEAGRSQSSPLPNPTNVKLPKAPGSVTHDGDECRKCWTKGHFRFACPYRRHRPTSWEMEIRYENLKRLHEGSNSGAEQTRKGGH